MPVDMGRPLPDDVREIALCTNTPVIAWTAMDASLAQVVNGRMFCYTNIPIYIWPCCWPYIFCSWPCMLIQYSKLKNETHNSFWILTETELKVVAKDHEVHCIEGCATSGDIVKIIPLESITKIRYTDSYCPLGCALPKVYVDTVNVACEHEATGIALAGPEVFVQQVMHQRDFVLQSLSTGTVRQSAVATAVTSSPAAAFAVMERGDQPPPPQDYLVANKVYR
jgi:hypothetical protein